MSEKEQLPPLGQDDPATDAGNNLILKNAIDKAVADDPTRFTTRSFAVIWNEGHSVRLVSTKGRGAISIPWDEVEPLRIILGGTKQVGGGKP